MSTSTVARIAAVAARAIDLAVQLRLSFVEVEKPSAIDASSVDVQQFWRESRVANPAVVQVARQWSPFEGPYWRELDLTGESIGPGNHAGSRQLMATAHIRRSSEPAPLVLLIHGYAVPFTGYDRWLALRMRRLGAHTIRLDLPYHLRRAQPGKFSGDGFFSIDPARTRAVVRQSVEDAAALVAWARREVTPIVSVVGVSLGGLVGALLAAQVELDTFVGVVPLCDPPASFTERSPGITQHYLGMIGQGEGYWGPDPRSARKFLDGALAPLVPRRMTPVTPAPRVALACAINDMIVGDTPVAELATAWGTELWTYPFGHITVMNAPGIARRICARAVRGPGEAMSEARTLAG